MEVLLVDFETTSLDVNKARIIEVGAVLYSVHKGSWEQIDFMAELVWDKGDAELGAETTEITKITNRELLAQGKSILEVLPRLAMMAAKAKMCIAHNAPYDRGVLKSVVERNHFDFMPGVPQMVAMDWCCTVSDLKEVKNFKCKRLSHMAVDVGVSVHPKNLHRAINDVYLLANVLQELRASPEEMLAYRDTPEIVLNAKIPGPWLDNGVGKAAAQKLGYSWQTCRGTDGPVYEKLWVKKIKQTDLEEEKRLASFEIKVIQSAS